MTVMPDPLTPDQAAVLAMARRRFRYPGARDEAIRRELGLSPWQYTQRLLALTRVPAAWEAEPNLMKRLTAGRRGA